MDRREAYLNSMLPLLDKLMGETPYAIMRHIADNFRARRVEKNISRRELSERTGVPMSTIRRFEQQAQISLESLVRLAVVLNYSGEIKTIFDEPKYRTLEELALIKDKMKDQRAYPRGRKLWKE